tara:strand:+ start:10414 stop:11127 length:714 start_codon:yes stop_codon:yes gene_type:complete
MTKKISNSLLPHFSELRKRILHTLIFFAVVFVVLYPFSGQIFDAFVSYSRTSAGLNLIAIEVASPFLVPLRLVLFLTFLISAPYIIFQMLSFMAPGLYENEKNFIFSRSIIGALLFLGGICFCYFIVLPNVFNFFQSISPSLVEISTDITKFLDFSLLLFMAFGLASQVPIIVNGLILFNVLKKESLSKNRGWVLVLSFTFGMLLSPPDVISQIMLAVPVYLLFELGLLCSNEKKAQ